MWNRVVILALRVALGIGLLTTIILQIVVLPWMSGWMAQDIPEAAFMRWPLLGFSVLGLLCVEVIAIAIWRLLDAIEQTRIFDTSSFGWVDTILLSLAAGTALSFTCFIYLASTSLGPISVPGLALFVTVVAVSMLLLMLVMRALLHQAVVLQTEMDAVI